MRKSVGSNYVWNSLLGSNLRYVCFKYSILNSCMLIALSFAVFFCLLKAMAT